MLKKQKSFLWANIDYETDTINIDVDDEVVDVEHLLGAALIILNEVKNKYGFKPKVLAALVEDELKQED